jgi:FtsH-binding integral membrane protein
MTRIDRRAHDREAEAASGRRTWKLLGLVLLVTAIACWALLRALK